MDGTAGEDNLPRFDAAVAITTVLRPTLLRAVRSIFAQDLPGRVQILIGIDKRLGDPECLDILARECPARFHLTVIDLGYSTSSLSGGLYPVRAGGSLRTILSYAAHSKYVAYLDDDDWWAPDHLSGLMAAIQGQNWAFSGRWFVDQATGWPICPDEWDSVGPGLGINFDAWGGFTCPSTMMINKETCHFIFPWWSVAPLPNGNGEDRAVFTMLLKHGGWEPSGKHSCFYELREDDQRVPHHAREFAARGIGWIADRGQIDTIVRLHAEAEAALRDGDFKSAVAQARTALTLNPRHLPSLECLALANERSREGPAPDRVAA